MKGYKHTVVQIVFLLYILPLSLIGQAELICAEGDFRFKWHGQYFKSGTTIYACEHSLPDTIGIVNDVGILIQNNVTWTNVSPITPTLGALNTAKVNILHFADNEVEVLASFDDDFDEPHSMSIVIKSTVKMYYNEYPHKTKYAFDDNKVPQYPTYITDGLQEVPHKFLLNGRSDPIKIKTTPPKTYYSPFYSASNSDLHIFPSRNIADIDSLLFEFDELLSEDTIEINSYGCSTDFETIHFIGDSIKKEVDFIFLSDASGLHPSTTIDLERLIQQANKILNQAGLFLSYGQMDFDTLPYDFIHNFKMDREEQIYAHQTHFHGPDSIKWSGRHSGNYLVYLVKNLGVDEKNDAIRGKATVTAMGTNSLSLDVGESPNGLTLAHEIGHTAYGLQHPEEFIKDYINITCCPNQPYNINCCANDPPNFMWGNQLLSKGMIRAYQYKIIQTVR